MARVALVTGGSRGIGEAISKKLKSEGYEVAATYAGNDEAASKFTEATGIKTYKWNVADYDSSKAGIEQVEADLGPIDIVVANAGITRDAPFHKMTPEMWHQVIDTNLTGVFNTVHPVWPGMRERKFGRVMFNASRAALGAPTRTAYSASKAGMIGMARTWALELAPHGITVNVVAPGPVLTDNFWGIVEKDSPQQEALAKRIPVGRIGTVQDVTNAFLFFCNPENSFVTGQTLYVCGGASVGTLAI